MTHRTALASIVGLALVFAAVSGCGDSGGGKPAVAIEGTIVFIAPKGAKTMDSDIYLLDAGGTRRLAGDGALAQAYPAWSPDGTQIAYITDTHQLAVVNRDGSGGALLTPQSDDSSLWAREPAWLPDGNISVLSGEFSDGKLAVLRPDGSGVRVLTVPKLQVGYAWSPDGTEVVYFCYPDVCLFDVERGEARTLVETREVGEFHAFAWSPDGTKILAGPGSGGGIDLAEDVYMFDADGQDLHALPQPDDQLNPAWSPDGTMIVYESFSQDPGSDTGQSLDLWVMNADGSGAQELLSSNGITPREADWTAD